MPTHRLSIEDRIRGLRKGIRVLSQKRGGPKWLLPSMKGYLKRLEAERDEKRAIRRRSKRKKPIAA